MYSEKSPKHLYSDIPPTILRNRKEKFRSAKDNPFWLMVGDYVFLKMVKTRFYSFMHKGFDNVIKERDNTKAILFYTNHNNWWDGIIGYCVARFLMKGRLRLMIEEMNRFPLFQYVGCFPVNKKTPQEAVKSLKYAAGTLNKPDINFWLFPQGIIRPPHYRPEVFQTGLAYLVENAVKKFGGINICPVSVNYTFLRQDKPEVVMEFGKVQKFYDFPYDRKDFIHKLEREFEIFCDRQFEDISKGNFEGYIYFYKRHLSWWREIERRLKNIGMKDVDKQ